jgi:putative FmdB family regulatory protein
VPTYDYVCEACGHELEVFQSMSEKRLRKCPKCGKSRLVRKVGAGAGLIFKGSGFYQTDYKKSAVPPSESKPAEKAAEGPAAKDAPPKPDAAPKASPKKKDA